MSAPSSVRLPSVCHGTFHLRRDFEGKRFWIIGYEPATGYAETPYYINEYKWNEDGTYSEVGDVAIVDITMSTLQDCYYKDGHIYILAGWGKSEKNPSAGQYVSIHDYNTSTKRIETTLASTSKDEAEGFAYVQETNSFIVTTWTRGGSTAYYWHVALPGTEPYYTTLDKENLYDFDRYNVDGEKNYEVYSLALNDMCEYLKLPADAKSVKAAKVSYSREGVCGVNSVCLPFALKPEMVDGGIYTVSGTKENSVTLAKQAEGVAAGVPCFVKSDSDWNITLDCLADNNGEMYDIAVAPVAPTGDVKLFGSYKTTNIGEGFYKVDESGKSLLHTSASSKTFPFRAFLQLPSSVNAAQITFADDEADGIKSVAADVANGAVYNLAGQRINANAKGLVIINGRKVVR